MTLVLSDSVGFSQGIRIVRARLRHVPCGWRSVGNFSLRFPQTFRPKNDIGTSSIRHFAPVAGLVVRLRHDFGRARLSDFSGFDFDRGRTGTLDCPKTD